MKKLIIMLTAIAILTGCTVGAAIHGKSAGNSHGMFFANPKTEHAPYR